MPKMRLGGVKALEKHAYLTSLCRGGADTLGDICSRLAADRINLSLLTHIADTGERGSITNACTEGTDGFSSYVHWKESHDQCSVGKLLPDISLVSIFPHDQKPSVTGSLIGVLDSTGIMPYGFASSPSAMTTLLAPSDFEGLIGGLFANFEFQVYASAFDWQDAYRSQEKPVKEVVCSYQEEIIKIYNITRYIDLDLWHIALPHHHLGDFGKALLGLDDLQLRLPFLVSNCSPDKQEIYFSFCFAATHRDHVSQALHQNLPGRDGFCLGPVSLFFLLGPHFGDRYGIANTLLRVLRDAGIPLLALSYTVSSFSLVIQGNDPDQTMAALYSNFQIPGRKP
jgi:hypothetical protein